MSVFNDDKDNSNDPIKFIELCWTGTTLYALDEEGYVWYIEMKSGKWAMHGNPTIEDYRRELKL